MRPLEIVETPTEGVNLVDPPWKLQPGKVRRSINIIMRNGKAEKTRGTTRLTPTAVFTDQPVPWVRRYYGRQADGTDIKKTHFFSNGRIYVVNDVNGATTQVVSGLVSDARPTSEVMQISGNSVEYVFSGNDRPYFYDGNAGDTWYRSAITQEVVQGVAWLDRLWQFTDKSSTLRYSVTLEPENLTGTDAGEITIGNEKDSYIVGLVVYRDTLFIFKTQSIWYIEGRVPARFEVRRADSYVGCVSRNSIITVEDLVFFVGSDGHMYFFNGIKPRLLDRELNFPKLINRVRQKFISATYHDHLVRVSYAPSIAQDPSPGPATTYESDEVVFPTTEFDPNELPKFSFTRGANIGSYAVLDQQGDDNILLVGRSEVGLVMFMGRGTEYDSSAMETDLWTRDIPFGTRNARIEDYIIEAAPKGSSTLDMETYLDGRLGTNSVDSFSQAGEQTGLGLILVNNQIRYHHRVVPFISFGRGQTTSCRFVNRRVGFDFSLEAVIVRYRQKEKIAGQGVGT